MKRLRAMRLAPLPLLLAACATGSARAPGARPASDRETSDAAAPVPRVDTSVASDARGAAVLADTANSPLSEPAVLETATGQATYYADMLEGRTTASGVPYRRSDMIAAHRTYPFGTVIRVTNLRNNRSVVVRVMDRGPWGDSPRQRATIIDLSRAAAERLDYIRDGRVPVQVDVLEWGDRSR